MAGEHSPLTREMFLYLAQEAGLDVDSPHMDELFPYVRAVLDGLKGLREFDVSGSEPDMAFIPERE